MGLRQMKGESTPSWGYSTGMARLAGGFSTGRAFSGCLGQKSFGEGTRSTGVGSLYAVFACSHPGVACFPEERQRRQVLTASGGANFRNS